MQLSSYLINVSDRQLSEQLESINTSLVLHQVISNDMIVRSLTQIPLHTVQSYLCAFAETKMLAALTVL